VTSRNCKSLAEKRIAILEASERKNKIEIGATGLIVWRFLPIERGMRKRRGIPSIELQYREVRPKIDEDARDRCDREEILISKGAPRLGDSTRY
jgi:hypothetical protein